MVQTVQTVQTVGIGSARSPKIVSNRALTSSMCERVLRLERSEAVERLERFERASDFRSDSRCARFVVREARERHETDSLIAVLFE